jgi:hypothetical protein
MLSQPIRPRISMQPGLGVVAGDEQQAVTHEPRVPFGEVAEEALPAGVGGLDGELAGAGGHVRVGLDVLEGRDQLHVLQELVLDLDERVEDLRARRVLPFRLLAVRARLVVADGAGHVVGLVDERAVDREHLQVEPAVLVLEHLVVAVLHRPLIVDELPRQAEVVVVVGVVGVDEPVQQALVDDVVVGVAQRVVCHAYSAVGLISRASTMMRPLQSVSQRPFGHLGHGRS